MLLARTVAPVHRCASGWSGRRGHRRRRLEMALAPEHRRLDQAVGELGDEEHDDRSGIRTTPAARSGCASAGSTRTRACGRGRSRTNAGPSHASGGMREHERERVTRRGDQPRDQDRDGELEAEHPPDREPTRDHDDRLPHDQRATRRARDRRPRSGASRARAPSRGTSQNITIAVRQPTSNASARMSVPKYKRFHTSVRCVSVPTAPGRNGDDWLARGSSRRTCGGRCCATSTRPSTSQTR